jgi:hypothetical protein
VGRDGDRPENRRGDIDRLSRFVARLLARPWVKQHFVVIRAEIQLGHSVEMACGHMIEDHTQDGETKSRIDDIPKPCGSSLIPGSPLRNHTRRTPPATSVSFLTPLRVPVRPWADTHLSNRSRQKLRRAAGAPPCG